MFQVVARAGTLSRSDINPLWESFDYCGPPAVFSKSDKSKDPTITKSYVFPSKHTTTCYDYVIVGSGSGGGVAASTILAENPGARVLVIEKGSPVQTDKLSQVEIHGMAGYYEKKGLQTTSDGNIMILAGSCLGGGSE